MEQSMIIGYIGKDAHITDVQGQKVVNFNVAIDKSYINKQGVKAERTKWYECAKWDAVNLAPYLKKGVQVCCIGEIEANAYAAKDTGELKASLKLSVLRLQLLSSGKKETTTQAATQEQSEPAVVDDLPF